MQSDLKPCPLCGALPCDWVDDPHKMEVGLCWTLAKIREVLGVNEKPMMDELPGIIKDRIAALEAEVARKDEALRRLAYWFDTDEDYLAGLSEAERADNNRMLSIARAALGETK